MAFWTKKKDLDSGQESNKKASEVSTKNVESSLENESTNLVVEKLNQESIENQKTEEKSEETETEKQQEEQLELAQQIQEEVDADFHSKHASKSEESIEIVEAKRVEETKIPSQNQNLKTKKKVNTSRQLKKQQKEAFKSLSKDDRKALKDRAKNVEKLNKPHNGPKELPLSEGNIIELKDVVKYYSNGYIVTQILKGVNLEIRRGDFVIILGPSGSGKTTLMNIISGLDRASDGVTNVNGTDLINLKDNELTKFRKENVGYVFQQYGLLPNLTVRENVEIGANLQADKSKRLDVFEILEAVGMLEHKDKFPHQLSGGQQQRVSIARAFAKNPTILFGDEPTGAIDEEMSKMVLKQFVDINKKYQTTVIIVTHNPIFEELGTLVVRIKDGNISSLIRNENPKDVDDLPWGQE